MNGPQKMLLRSDTQKLNNYNQYPIETKKSILRRADWDCNKISIYIQFFKRWDTLHNLHRNVRDSLNYSVCVWIVLCKGILQGDSYIHANYCMMASSIYAHTDTY